MASDDGPKCPKCGEYTTRCDVCRGEGSVWGGVSRVKCQYCNETGYVCPTHGKYWK